MREFGLYHSPSQAELAAWLRDQVATHGQNERALAASLIALRIAPSLDAYSTGGDAGRRTGRSNGRNCWIFCAKPTSSPKPRLTFSYTKA
ncbi:MAG: hypothetical protein R3F36_09890 [Candidatus Competibacteraceae bacterium]